MINMYWILAPFSLVALALQAFANYPSDHESRLLPSTYRSSQQSDKSILDVDLLKRSSSSNFAMYAACNNAISVIHPGAKPIDH